MPSGRAYQRKGDPFTLRVLEGRGPLVVRELLNVHTGRQYFTRVPAEMCDRLPGGACPHCGRVARVLYGSPWGAAGEVVLQGVTGCWGCLGLTSLSSSRRGTPDWARDVLEGRARVRSERVRHQAERIEAERVARIVGKVGRLLGR